MLETKDVQNHPKKKEFWQKKRGKANRKLDHAPKVIRRIDKKIREINHKIKKAKAKRASKKPDFNGCPSNVTKAVADHIVRGNKHGLVVSATSNGTHAVGSWHYQSPCMAADMYGLWEDMVEFQRDEHDRGASNYNELFGPDGFYVKNGTTYSGHFPNHGDHTHGAPK